jgi:hypothetical protein
MALRHAVVSTGIPSLPEICYVSIFNIFMLGGQFIGTPVLSDMLAMTLQLCGKYAMCGAQTASSDDLLLKYIVIGKDNVKTESGRPNIDGSTV